MRRKFRLGLIINPYAGIGGALALKGSDGAEVREKALAMGAQQQAMSRARLALTECLDLAAEFELLVAAGDMGEHLATELNIPCSVVYQPSQTQTEAEDTIAAAKQMAGADIDLLLFAGGDGTARNIYAAVGEHLPVLGIPAGCKIHSGVYAITPQAAGRVAAMMIKGELVSVQQADVMDIDEARFREGKVIAKAFGEMRVPEQLRYVQATKMGGKESDELVLADIAAQIIDDMQEHPDCQYVMGSGSTVAAIMQELGLENTLLGVDVVREQRLYASDVTSPQLIDMVTNQSTRLVITLIGGQGHIFGRGNQQLSPAVIRAVGLDNILIVATKTKLQQLQGRPLIADTGDIALDQQLAGPVSVITGYRDEVLYPVANLHEELA